MMDQKEARTWEKKVTIKMSHRGDFPNGASFVDIWDEMSENYICSIKITDNQAFWYSEALKLKIEQSPKM